MYAQEYARPDFLRTLDGITEEDAPDPDGTRRVSRELALSSRLLHEADRRFPTRSFIHGVLMD